MDLGLQGKHAIVTGGSRGIGKAIARELAREGADLAIVARNKADLEATGRELAAETNRRIIPLAADVTSKEQVDRMVAEAAQQLGGLHILVNSGSAPGGSATATGPIETVIDEDLIEDFNVKYVGALRCSRAIIPFMKTAGWGRIINISGGNARNAGNLSGGARNAGLVHMTKTLAVQLGRHGITVNCIHPGTTRTERTPSLLAARAASWACPRKRRSGGISCRTRRAATPSAAWSTLRRSRSSQSSWPRIRPGRSPASWSRQAAAPGGRYITEPRRLTFGRMFASISRSRADGYATLTTPEAAPRCASWRSARERTAPRSTTSAQAGVVTQAYCAAAASAGARDGLSSRRRGNTSAANRVMLATVSAWSRNPPCPNIKRLPKPSTLSCNALIWL